MGLSTELELKANGLLDIDGVEVGCELAPN